MIEQLFQLVLKLSFEATIAGVLILIIKLIFGKKLTKRFNYLIWGFVFIKFILIISPPSMLSLFNYTDISLNIAKPFASTIPKSTIESSDNLSDTEKFDFVPKDFDVTASDNEISSINTNDIKINWLMIASYSWLFITLFLLLYLLWNYLNLKINVYKRYNPEFTKKYNNSFCTYFNEIGISINTEIISSQYAKTPFVFGCFKPLIVIPENLLNLIDEEEIKSIIYHEATHIKLNHHKIRLITNIITIIHWFNPFAWIFLRFMQNDAEFYCDNQVLLYHSEVKEDNYLNTLLKVAKLRQNNSITIINFGQSNLKRRVLNIINRKSIPNYAMLLSFFLTLILSATVLTSAMTNNKEPDDSNETNVENLYYNQLISTTVYEIAESTKTIINNDYSYSNSSSAKPDNGIAVYDMNTQNSISSVYNQFIATDINKLDIDVNVVSVELQESKNNYIDVSFTIKEKYHDSYTFSSVVDEENILKIHVGCKPTFQNSINLKDTEATLVILLPQKSFEEFIISLDASTFIIENPLNIKNMSVELNASTADIYNTTIKYFNGISNAGTLNLKNNTIENDFYVYNNAGNLNLYTDNINCDLIISNDTGNVNLYFSEKLDNYNLTVFSSLGSVIFPTNWQYEETGKGSYGFDKTYNYNISNGSNEVKNAVNIENNTGNVKVELTK